MNWSTLFPSGKIHHGLVGILIIVFVIGLALFVLLLRQDGRAASKRSLNNSRNETALLLYDTRPLIQARRAC